MRAFAWQPKRGAPGPGAGRAARGSLGWTAAPADEVKPTIQIDLNEIVRLTSHSERGIAGVTPYRVNIDHSHAVQT
jgi:hypothetical protein